MFLLCTMAMPDQVLCERRIVLRNYMKRDTTDLYLSYYYRVLRYGDALVMRGVRRRYEVLCHRVNRLLLAYLQVSFDREILLLFSLYRGSLY